MVPVCHTVGLINSTIRWIHSSSRQRCLYKNKSKMISRKRFRWLVKLHDAEFILDTTAKMRLTWFRELTAKGKNRSWSGQWSSLGKLFCSKMKLKRLMTTESAAQCMPLLQCVCSKSSNYVTGSARKEILIPNHKILQMHTEIFSLFICSHHYCQLKVEISGKKYCVRK